MEWVRERLQGFGDRAASVDDFGPTSYAELIEKIDHWGTFFRDSGIAPEHRVAVLSEYDFDTAAILFALFEIGCVVVPLDPREKRVSELLHDAHVNRVIHVDTFLKPMSASSCRIVEHGEPGRPPHPLLEILRARDEAGIVVFTSGSTGKAKAVLLSCERVLGKFRSRISRDRITQLFLKLDHFGGLNTLFSILLNGGTVVHCERRTVADICECIELYSVQLLPTTPTFLNMLVMSGIADRYDLSSLEIVSYGTEVMSEGTLRAVNRLLPGVTLKQTYGLSELGVFPTRSKSSDSRFMKVGGNGVELKVVDGTVHVRSTQAMLGYLNAESPFDEEGWYDTGDSAQVIGDYICILGRRSEIINVGGEKFHPSEVENHLLSMDNVREVVVRGHPSKVTGCVVVAEFVLKEDEPIEILHERVHSHCSGAIADFKIPAVVRKSGGDSLMGPRFKKRRDRSVLEPC